MILLGFPSDGVPDEVRARIAARAGGREIVVTSERGRIEELLPRIEVAVRSFPRELLHEAPSLRWFQQWHAGADWLDRHPAAVEAPFVLTGAQGVHAIPISEHVLSFLFAFARGLPGALRAQDEKRWVKDETVKTFELAGKTMLLLGVGAIGARVAAAASGLGMRVVGLRSDPTKAVAGVDEMHGVSALTSLLPRADFVVNTLPLTRETRGLIGEEQLAAMKTSAYLINIGRGGTVDEAALTAALKSGGIAGAGLDVFEREPLPGDSDLWGLENVIVTSHYSGNTPHYDERAFDIFLDNLERYVAGRPLRNIINKRRGY